MPTRLLRDWTDSFRIAKLSPEEERLFIRIIMKADDFGRFHADARLLLSNCLPLVSQVTVEKVEKWLEGIESADLISVYSDKSGRKILEIKNFKQRTRAQVSKFPANDGQTTVKCPSIDSPPRSETEAYSEAEAGNVMTSEECVKPNHAPTREQALGWLKSVIEHGADYTEFETIGAWLALNANGWKWGKNNVADWRSAIESKIQDTRKLDDSRKSSKPIRGNPIRAGGGNL